MSQDPVSISLAEQQSTLQNNTHKAMVFLMVIGAVLLYQFRSLDDLAPFFVISSLLWVNAILLIKGFRDVLEGHKSKVAVMAVQMIFILGGIALVTQKFKGQHIPLILGSTTWIIALFWASTQRKISTET